MTKAIRVTFLLPRPYAAALKKLRASDPAIRSRTDALLHVIRAGLRSINSERPVPRGTETVGDE